MLQSADSSSLIISTNILLVLDQRHVRDPSRVCQARIVGQFGQGFDNGQHYHHNYSDRYFTRDSACRPCLSRYGLNFLLNVQLTFATASAHLWHMITFAYYMARANGRPTDGLFRQQQAILRNLLAPVSLLTDYVKLWWAWRRCGGRALTRSITLIFLCSVFSLATVMAGILSSYIIDNSNIEVLVQSPFCAPIFTGEENGTIPVRNYIGLLTKVSQSYADDCYTDQIILPGGRKSFAQASIPFTSKRILALFLRRCALRTKR